MRKLITILLLVACACTLMVPAMAAGNPPVITQQPQNPTFVHTDIAEYSVTVYGKNLRCVWYLHFDGHDYNISDTSGGMKPWEQYAGETYGPSQTSNGDFTTFTYSFNGIERELGGSTIYAVIEDGHYDLTSAKAMISVVDNCGTPPKTNVPVEMEVCKGDVLDLYCQATAPDGSELSYLWYETSSGKLQDIIAVDRGTEDRDTLRVDTSSYGTRYYVCAVTTSNGGSAYSSVIPVTVVEAQPTGEPPVIKTETLPEAPVEQEYEFRLDCSDKNAVFNIHYNPGKANDFESTGMTLSEDGVIKGIPHVYGRFVFTVCAGNEYGEDYKTYILDVVESGIEVEVLEVPDKVEYYAGETLDLTGLKVRIRYPDGTHYDSLNGQDLTITTKPLTTLGEQKIKVAYGDTFDIFIVMVREVPATDPTDPTDPTEPSEEETTAPTEAPTKPSEGGDVVKPTTDDANEKDTQKKGGMPWWGVLLITLGAAGAGVGIAAIFLKKK